jgi:hypothetical protein
LYVTTLPPAGFLSVASSALFAAPPAFGLLELFHFSGARSAPGVRDVAMLVAHEDV